MLTGCCSLHTTRSGVHGVETCGLSRQMMGSVVNRGEYLTSDLEVAGPNYTLGLHRFG